MGFRVSMLEAGAVGMFGAASPSKSLELDVYDVIGPYWGGVSAKGVRQALKDAGGVETIRVRINSRGGDVVDGLAIYEDLRAHPARVEVDITSLAASMASIIALAGDERRIAAGGLFMIHNPWGFGVGESKDLRAHADLLDKMRDTLANLYAARSGQNRADVLKWMADETWLNAEEAKARGFVDTVLPAKASASARAQAFAALAADRSAFANMPAELAAEIERFPVQRTVGGLEPRIEITVNGDADPERVAEAVRLGLDRASLGGPLGGGPRNTNPPGPEAQEQQPPRNLGEEKDEMAQLAIITALAAILGLDSSKADEASIQAEVGKLKTRGATLDKIEAATGKTGEECVGVVLAFQASHEKLPGVEKELAETRKTSAQAELDNLLEQGRKERKLTKAEADKLREQVEGGTVSLDAAKGFVAVMSPKRELAEGAAIIASQERSDKGQTVPGALAWDGKTYENLTYSERAELADSDPHLHRAMKKDWEKRGEPAGIYAEKPAAE